MLRSSGRIPAQVRRIGAFSSPALGDTLLASAPLQDLRATFPNAELIFFCTPQNRLAAELLPAITALHTIQITRPWRSIPAIRKFDLDLFVDFSGWQRLTAFHALASGTRFTLGFRSEGQYRGRAYNLTEEHRRDRHEINNLRALTARIGVKSVHPPAIKPQPDASYEKPDKDLILFHPWPAGAKSHLREWPLDHWLELARCLNAPGRRFLITGGPADADRSRQMAKAMSAAAVEAEYFSSPGSLAPLIAAIRTARLVVSVNTGIMHLAAILGAPTISINGPTSNIRWGPVGNRCLGINSPGTGCGFLNFGYEFDGNPTDCMQRITVSSVMEGVARLWAKTDMPQPV